jgi:hypothetical protein
MDEVYPRGHARAISEGVDRGLLEYIRTAIGEDRCLPRLYFDGIRGPIPASSFGPCFRLPNSFALDSIAVYDHITQGISGSNAADTLRKSS